MTLAYDFLLMVVLSTSPNAHELYFYQYPTWADCKTHETALRAEILANTKNPGSVTISCRRDIRIVVGSAEASR